MSMEKVMELTHELSALSEDAKYLHELLTTEVRKHWKGDAAQACLRESSDNRETAVQAIEEYRAWAEGIAQYDQPIPGNNEVPAEKEAVLPESLLL